MDSTSTQPGSVSFNQAFLVWVRVALQSFGGPAGQIAVMHRILVEEKRWVSENRFLHALNYCMLLPGPEAQQLATYIGWLLHKTKGGLIAGTLFILPGFVAILALSFLYAGFRETKIVESLFFGIKPAVMAIVVEAVFRIGRRALKNEVMALLAAFAFIAIFFFDVPFPLIIIAAGIIGYAGGHVREDKFYVLKVMESETDNSLANKTLVLSDSAVAHTLPSVGHSVRVLSLSLLLWWGPIGAMILFLGMSNIYVTVGLFFSKAAVVTFGGAYAVLAYIAQQAVDSYGWLQPGEMLDGLGMAETTPGPLIQVVQFVGFMGAFRNPGSLDPMVAGVLGSIVTTWVTFVPCFLWIFLGAPYIEYLRGKKSLSTALSGITAAIVGVILNLALWFSLHTLFAEVNEIRKLRMRFLIPELNTLDVASLIIAVGAFVAIFRFKLSMLTTLAGSVILSFCYHFLVKN